MIIRFGQVELDEDAYELRRDGRSQRVEPKVLDLLFYMARHRGRLVTKDELLDHVWPDAVVAESALTRAMSLARASIGDTARGQGIIETVSGKGYRFRAQVEEAALVSSASPAATTRLRVPALLSYLALLLLLLPTTVWFARQPLLGFYLDWVGLADPPTNPSLPDRPSIAVLPFADLGLDGAHTYVAEGIADELTVDLGRRRELFVISRSSAFMYRGGAVDVRRVGRELGVRYVVDGTVRVGDGWAVVSAQLVDATSGFQLWSGRYKRALAAVLDLQGDLSGEILNAIDVRIGEAEIERTQRMPQTSPSIYPTYVLAQTHWYRFTRDDNQHAERLLRQALSIEPNDAHSHALLASTHLAAYVLGWDPTPERLQLGYAAALRAVELDPFSARGHAGLAIAHLWMDRRQDALAAALRAVELGPNSDLCHGVRAMTLAEDKSVDQAIYSLNRALRLNPRSPSLYWMLLGYMYEAVGREELAVATWQRVREANRDMMPPRLELLSYFDAQGQQQEVTELAQEILRINPDFTAELALRLDRRRTAPAAVARLRAQLHRAGIP